VLKLRAKGGFSADKVAKEMEGDATRVYKTTTNGASNVAAFPPVWSKRGGVREEHMCVQMMGPSTSFPATCRPCVPSPATMRVPIIRQVGDDEDRATMVSVLAKVSFYANNHLDLDSTLEGNGHELDDDVGMHMGIFAIYEYQPSPDANLNKVGLFACDSTSICL
jgi:hypothetical protein